MAEQRRRYYSGDKAREYTPEERKIIEHRRRIARERRRHSRNAMIAVIILLSIGVAAVCIWYFGYVRPYDNYDAQMRIGIEKFKIKHYDEAEEAFKKALSKRPNDPDATIALSDTYAAEDKYEDAIRGMKALQGIDDADTRSYERLITWYVEGTKDIEAANGQIIAAYDKQLALANEHIKPAPTFSPDSGDFSEVTLISIRADKGLTIYFSKDGSIPTPDSGEKYDEKISLVNNEESIYTAVSYNKDGLMSWPATAAYSLAVKYSVDTSAFEYLGDTARAIMNDVGPLYYDSRHESGYYYYDDNEVFYYVFSSGDFTVEHETTDGAIEDIAIDPNTEPLPSDAVCTAISMKVSDYIVGMDGNLNVDDFMMGIGVAEYDVDRDGQDGKYHLTYSANKKSYDITLKNKSEITSGREILVTKK